MRISFDLILTAIVCYSSNQLKINLIAEIKKILDQRFQRSPPFSVSQKKFHRAMEILSKYPSFKEQVSIYLEF